MTGTGVGVDPIDQVILIKGWSGNKYLGAQIAANFITNYHGGAITSGYSDNLAIQDNLIYNCSNGALVEIINDCNNANIFNNFFGTDYNCVLGLSLSQGSTIELTDCDNCVIGGSRGQCKGNVIVASVNNGSRKAINIASNCEGTTVIQGNYINVSKDQGECISNSSSQAVYVEGTIAGSKVTIGGDSTNMRNDICGGTNGTGIELNFQQTTAGNLIQGNLIGCRSTGCTINGNDLLYGIRIQGLTGSTTIGWGSGAVTSNLINKIGYCDEAIRNENRPNITWGGVLCWRNTNSGNVFNNNGASANGAIAPPVITSVNVTTGVITGTGVGGIVDVYLWDGPLSPQLGYSKQGYKFLGRATGSPWTLNLGTAIPSGDIAAYQINGTSSSEWASYDVPTQGPFGNLNCIALNMPCWQAGGCTIPIPYAPTIGSIVQPTCSVSTGSINLLGLPTVNWTMTMTPGGSVINGSGTSYSYVGLNPGTYTFSISIAGGQCNSVISNNALILPIPGVPIIGAITQPTCTTSSGSVNISGLPAIGNWTITATPGGSTVTGSGTSTSFGNLAPGNYTFVVTNGTCPSGTSQSVLINAAPVVPAIPTTTSNPATCTANGTASISNFTAGQIYVFTPIGPTVSGGSISGMTPGSNYTVTAGNGSCNSSASSSFSISAQLAVPAIPTTTTNPATCSANGTASIGNFTAGQTYVFTPAGPTVSAGSISGMTPGTNYTVTAGNGSCTSSASSSFSISAQLAVPAIPTTTTNPATCSANGTASISNFTAGQIYVFTPVGPTVSGGSISGMTPGSNYTVTAGNGSCNSSASSSFSISAQLAVPAIPTTTTNPATCSANGTASIGNFTAGQTYVFTPAVPTVSAGSISGMTPGTNYTVTAGNGSCTSSASSSFSISAQLAVPAIPTTTTNPATCSANGTASISNFTAGQIYVFTPVGPTVSGGSISGMTPGSNYTVTAGNGSCNSSASSSFSISAQLAVPAIPTTTTNPATCSANGTASIGNFTAGQTYVFTPAVPTVSAGSISGMTPGTNYTVTAGNGSCTSSASSSFSISAQLAVPVAPTTTTNPATCTANGTASISNFTAGQIYVFTPVGPTVSGGSISGMTPGTNYTVTAGNGSCNSSASSSFSISAQLAVPAIPTTTTNPASCAANGTASIGNFTAGQTYVFTPTGPTESAGSISGMTPGTNYTVATGNGSCTSSASSSFSISAQLSVPAIPTTTTNPATCSANGTASISNFTAGQIYVFTPAGPTVSGGSISGMIPGTNYTVTAGNGSCTSSASSSFSISAQLSVPAIPTTTTNPATCSANGTASISNFTTGQTYVFTPSGPTVSAGSISGMTPGSNYTVTAGNGSCTSVASTTFSIAAQLITPIITLTPTDPSSCNGIDGSIIVNTGAPGSVSWSGTSNGSSGPMNSNYSITGLSAGSYDVTFTNSLTGCQSAVVATNLLNPGAPIINPIADVTQCGGSYTLPVISGTSLINAQYYTQANGGGGIVSEGTLFEPDTVITLYAYDANGACTASESFTITLTSIPVITNPGAQTACDSYTLGTFSGTNIFSPTYWTQSGGQGTQLNIGDLISTSSTVFIYDQNGACTSEESFDITIIQTPSITNPGNQSACATYSLPVITGSNLTGSQEFFNNSQALGGTAISGAITSSLPIYIYDANGACSDEESFQVTINPLPTATISGEATYCQGDVVADVITTVNGSPIYTLFYSINGTNQTPATSSSSTFNLGSTAGIYVLDSLTDANCLNNALSSNQTITINPIPGPPAVGTDTSYCSNANPVDLTVSGSGSFTWYDNNNNNLATGATYTPEMNLGTTTYNVSQTLNGCEGPTASVVIIVEECGIIVPTAFTPDNDNTNDIWVLDNIDQIYPNNVVTIFNRWGNQIYQSSEGKYETNSWDGKYNDELLPVGSYYFVIQYNDSFTENKSGIVTIIK